MTIVLTALSKNYKLHKGRIYSIAELLYCIDLYYTGATLKVAPSTALTLTLCQEFSLSD